MRTLIDELRRRYPDLVDPESAVAAGLVEVAGTIVTNPRSRVPAHASVVIREPKELRGTLKLRAALDAFGVDPAGRVALDVGAAAGGFTAALLERGAARVYAVDVGHGQLLGSLRQDPRVVNLEATNVAALGPGQVPEPIGLVTVDVSYLSLAEAVRQAGAVTLEAGAELVGLVKPMFELRRATAPTDRVSLSLALDAAVAGIRAAGWRVQTTIDSPTPGAKGALELFVHARRR